MKTARVIARVLFYLTRILAIIAICIGAYAIIVLGLSAATSATWLPLKMTADNTFVIFYPFTTTPFLLGDYTNEYLTTTLLTLSFYGLFLWLLGSVFHAFMQQRLFSKKGFMQLWRFYMVNLTVPILLLVLVAVFGQEPQDIVRITFLHMVIGVFAFFMAAIFKQGLLLQEEQDLIF
jgi:hypothetical protein